MNFKKWVKSIQTAGYNDTRTVSNNQLLVVISMIDKQMMLQHGLMVSKSSFKIKP